MDPIRLLRLATSRPVTVQRLFETQRLPNSDVIVANTAKIANGQLSEMRGFAITRAGTSITTSSLVHLNRALREDYLCTLKEYLNFIVMSGLVS